VQVPAIQAAIEAGVHYCDLGVIGNFAHEELQLDAQSRSRRVIAIISAGWITVMNLRAVHAADQLNETHHIFICWLTDYTPEGYFHPARV
jgi:saccharopine dehydrogenase-like NADP-dependent oxidoreductase